MCQFKEGIIIGKDGEDKTKRLLTSLGYTVHKCGGTDDCDLYATSDKDELMRIGGYYKNGEHLRIPILQIECKRDLRADETGNLAFEILSSARNFAPGSLLKTQAHLLSHVTDSKIYLINRAQLLSWIIVGLQSTVDRLLRGEDGRPRTENPSAARTENWRLIKAHDNAQMRGLLIPIEDLLGTKVDVQVFPVIENGDEFEKYLKAYGCRSGKCNL